MRRAPAVPSIVLSFLVASSVAAGCGSGSRDGFDDEQHGGVARGTVESPASDASATTAIQTPDSGQKSCEPASLDLAGCPCSNAGEIRACYMGPAATRGLGICHDGKQTCLGTSEFASWTACDGSILPTVETCASSVDTNCDGKVGCDDAAVVDASVPDVDAAPSECTDGETRPCYDGPAPTQGVGICKAGTQTCTGGMWSATCAGQTLPGSEGASCTDGADNDCDGLVDCADSDCAATGACCVPSTTVDGTIWANSPDSLYRIDPTTFAVTKVGDFSFDYWGFDSMTDVAVTPSGALYGVSSTTLYSIDKTNAHATEVATLSGSSNNALTFLAGGQLLGADGWGDVKRITPSTGSATTVGNYGNGLASSGDLVAIADGTMFAVSSTGAGGSDASGNNLLIRVDQATGKGTIVGPIGHANVWGLAYANQRVIGFTTAGKILEINPTTGASTVIASKSIEFWGAGQSPLVSSTTGCP